MCGRTTLTWSSLADVALSLGAEFDAADAGQYRPRYNAAPSDVLWLLVAGDDRPRIIPAVWGIPSSKKPAINVRAESLEHGAFRSRRRSALVVDGFYEWTGDGKQRHPVWFHRPGELMLLGAVDTPIEASTRAARAFAVVTTTPGEDLAAYHDRQPVIVARDQLSTWFAAGANDASHSLLRPSPPGTLQTRRVSSWTNGVRHDDPRCLDEWTPPPAPRQLSLL